MTVRVPEIFAEQLDLIGLIGRFWSSFGKHSTKTCQGNLLLLVVINFLQESGEVVE